MAIDPKIRPRVPLILSIALVVFLLDLIITMHLVALTGYFGIAGSLSYFGIAIRYLLTTIVICVVSFFAGLLFCVHRQIGWYGAAVALIVIFLFQANVYFTDYSIPGLIEATLNLLPRLILTFLILLAIAPILAALSAQLGSILHTRIGNHVKCPEGI